MPGDPGEIWSGAQGPMRPPQVLVEDTYGGGGGRLLQITFLRGDRHAAGGTGFTHYIQRGGGCFGPPLGIPDYRRGWERRQG